MKNLEDLNKQLIQCNLLGRIIAQECGTGQLIIHEEHARRVADHRKYWGITTNNDIFRGRMNTAKYCRTVKP